MKSGRFAGLIIVQYRNRVLQTAILRARVVTDEAQLVKLKGATALSAAPEALLRRNLGRLGARRAFDACLVLSDTATGKPAMTAMGRHGAFIASLEGIKDQLTEINRLLNQVALNTKRYAAGLRSKANAALLVDLAQEGRILYRKVVVDYMHASSAARDLEKSKYLQIVSMTPDSLVPLEFVYTYFPPTDGAEVCANAPRALKDGKCPSSCVPTANPATHVCPLGFWGLSKVIERHKHDTGLDKAAAIYAEDTVSGRTELSLTGHSLMAASRQVTKSERAALRTSVEAAWKGAVEEVATWSDWQEKVKRKRPVVLVALPHASGKGRNISLEISGDVLKSIFIDETYVGNPQRPPLVLLLGCDTAKVSATDAYFRYISVFRQARAALVLGTVATVLATDAAKVAARLVDELALAARARPARFGEVLCRVKRKAVADSLMMALCVVAFGDADWQLK
jgi:hypothetical protein